MDFSSYFDTPLFPILPTSGSALTVPFGPGTGDTAVGACRKRWKHCSGHSASTQTAECREINSPFVQCCKEDEYQQKLTGLLAEVRHRLAVPTLVAVDFLSLAEDFGHVYLVTNRSY